MKRRNAFASVLAVLLVVLFLGPVFFLCLEVQHIDFPNPERTFENPDEECLTFLGKEGVAKLLCELAPSPEALLTLTPPLSFSKEITHLAFVLRC